MKKALAIVVRILGRLLVLNWVVGKAIHKVRTSQNSGLEIIG